MNLVGLQDFASRKVTELSGGQSQRVAIARATAKNPEIIFADEPTGALDEATGKDILTLLKGLSRDRLVVAVSHDRKFAEEFGDRIIELADGKIERDSDGSYRDEPCRTGSARAEELNSPKLPLKTALRLGCGNLLRRPARTAITILLSATAFALTGLTISARPDGLEGLISADAVRTIADVAAAAGGIFAAFSMALMLNLMWQSAADRIKTVGILKACGAGSGLPAAMFACEAGITGLAAYAAAAATLFPLCGLANRYVLGDRADAGMTAFAPGLHAPCALLALAVAFILIGCALPTVKAAVLRPADMLREE